MKTISRVMGAALLIAAMPMALAQDASQADPPVDEQSRDAPATEPQEGDDTGEVKRTVDAIRAYTEERRAQALADAERAADALDRQTQRLQERMDQRWERMGQAARVRSQATMADLRQRRNALAEWYGGLRHGSAAAWEEVRNGFVVSYQELAEAVRKATAEFDRNNRGKDDKDGKDGKDDKEDRGRQESDAGG